MQKLPAARGLGPWLPTAGHLPRPVLVGVAADAGLAVLVVAFRPVSLPILPFVPGE